MLLAITSTMISTAQSATKSFSMERLRALVDLMLAAVGIRGSAATFAGNETLHLRGRVVCALAHRQAPSGRFF
jgi:hypothetical protein